MDSKEAKALTGVHGAPKVSMATKAMREAVDAIDVLWQGQNVDALGIENPYPGAYFHYEGSYDTTFEEVLESAMNFAIEHYPSQIWVLRVGDVAEARVFAGTEEEVLEALERGRIQITEAIVAYIRAGK